MVFGGEAGRRGGGGSGVNVDDGRIFSSVSKSPKACSNGTSLLGHPQGGQLQRLAGLSLINSTYVLAHCENPAGINLAIPIPWVTGPVPNRIIIAN